MYLSNKQVIDLPFCKTLPHLFVFRLSQNMRFFLLNDVSHKRNLGIPECKRTVKVEIRKEKQASK